MKACKSSQQSLLKGHLSIKFSTDLDSSHSSTVPRLKFHSRKGMWQLGEVLRVAPTMHWRPSPQLRARFQLCFALRGEVQRGWIICSKSLREWAVESKFPSHLSDSRFKIKHHGLTGLPARKRTDLGWFRLDTETWNETRYWSPNMLEKVCV